MAGRPLLVLKAASFLPARFADEWNTTLRRPPRGELGANRKAAIRRSYVGEDDLVGWLDENLY